MLDGLPRLTAGSQHLVERPDQRILVHVGEGLRPELRRRSPVGIVAPTSLPAIRDIGAFATAPEQIQGAIAADPPGGRDTSIELGKSFDAASRSNAELHNDL